MNKNKISAVIVGLVIMVVFFIILGSVTSIIPNPFFIRMTEIRWYDYLFLTLTAMLSGTYAGLWYYKNKTKASCEYSAIGGAFGGVFAFGCAICNKILVLLLGFSGVMTYFMPLQPLLGMISVGLLSYGVYQQVRL